MTTRCRNPARRRSEENARTRRDGRGGGRRGDWLPVGGRGRGATRVLCAEPTVRQNAWIFGPWPPGGPVLLLPPRSSSRRCLFASRWFLAGGGGGGHGRQAGTWHGGHGVRQALSRNLKRFQWNKIFFFIKYIIVRLTGFLSMT